jgi:hypothetical protein
VILRPIWRVSRCSCSDKRNVVEVLAARCGVPLAEVELPPAG